MPLSISVNPRLYSFIGGKRERRLPIILYHIYNRRTASDGKAVNVHDRCSSEFRTAQRVSLLASINPRSLRSFTTFVIDSKTANRQCLPRCPDESRACNLFAVCGLLGRLSNILWKTPRTQRWYLSNQQQDWLINRHITHHTDRLTQNHSLSKLRSSTFNSILAWGNTPSGANVRMTLNGSTFALCQPSLATTRFSDAVTMS